jgi:hypothetical protein
MRQRTATQFVLVTLVLLMGGAVWLLHRADAGATIGVTGLQHTTLGASPHASSTPEWVEVGVTHVFPFGRKNHYSFDATTFSVAAVSDVGVDSNTLTLYNTPTPTFGRIGQGLRFNGSTQYGSAGNIGTMRGVAFWIKPNSITTAYGLIQFASGVSVNMNSSGIITTSGISGATVYVDGEVSNTIPDTDWHHVVVTSSNDIVANAFQIARVGSTYFGGVVDDVRTSTSEYTAEDAKRLHGLGK